MLILQMWQFRSLLTIVILFFGGEVSVRPQTPKPIRATSSEGNVAFAFPRVMNTFEFSTPAPMSALSQVRGWHGIVPLRSTRRDVEKAVGSPSTPGGSSYETPDERVSVEYSDGPCEKGWPYGWNVVPNTVLTISVYPKSGLPLTGLNLDESKYEKWRAGHISGIAHYTDRSAGIDFEVNEFMKNVISVSYIPTAAERSLQCPDASKRLPPGRSQADSFFKFDEYGNIPFSYERERLDLFAAEMRRQPDSEGYIIAYAGAIARSGEARVRADCAKNYLIKKHHIKAETILAIDGGYRETGSVELYVEPQGGAVPLARPSVRPSKVKIIEVKKGFNSCINFVKSQARAIRALPTQPLHLSQPRPEDAEIYFGFDPTDPTRHSIEKSVVLSVRKGGKAEAVLYDRDRSAVVATYKGILSKAELRRLAGRARTAIGEANSRKLDDTNVRESDLFYLSIKFENGKVEETGGKVEDMPEAVRELVRDLNLLWRRFKETPRSPAYLNAKLIDKENFEALRRKGEVQFVSIEDFPLDLRQVITHAIIHSQDFHPLSQELYDQLQTRQRLVIYKGSGYVLNFFKSHKDPGPTNKKGSFAGEFNATKAKIIWTEDGRGVAVGSPLKK